MEIFGLNSIAVSCCGSVTWPAVTLLQIMDYQHINRFTFLHVHQETHHFNEAICVCCFYLIGHCLTCIQILELIGAFQNSLCELNNCQAPT